LDVENLRRQIPTTQQMTYLNTGWEGPSPTSVVEAIRARLDYENQVGPTSSDALESGKEVRTQAKEAIATLVNAAPREILLTENTTEGINIVLNGLPWQEDDEVITCDLEHPSILLPTYHLQDRHGVKVNVLPFAPNAEHSAIVSAVEEALSDRTRMVFLSHIEYSCGLRMPIEEIARLTRPRGIWLMVDGAQGPGHVSLDLRELGCDFYAMPGQKWLLGPDGTGALFIREPMVSAVQPDRVGSYSVKEFDLSGSYEPETENIDKFLVSTTSTPLRVGFLQAVRFISDIGIGEVTGRSAALASSFRAELSKVEGVEVVSPMDGPGCTSLVSFAIASADHEAVVALLWKNDGILARRVRYPDSIRASLAFFNTETEVAQLVESVRGLAKGR